jgi:hypothetical protein
LIRSHTRPTFSAIGRLDEKGAISVSPVVQILIDKIRYLPENRLAEVEDFVDFIRMREQQRALARDATAQSVPSFAAIWNNPEDDVYDAI